jgi:hypothetical protein
VGERESASGPERTDEPVKVEPGRAGEANEPERVAEEPAGRPGAGGTVRMPTRPAAAEQILGLQRSVGNRAVARLVSGRPSPQRLLSREAATAYVDPGVQKVSDANPSLTSDQQGGLQSLDQAHGIITSAWSKLKWEDVSAGAADRVANPSHIRQTPLGTCGPAAVLNYLAATEPGTFAYDVQSIFESGAWGKKQINQTLLNNECQPGMDPCDWMMMSAFQDLSNDFLDFYGRPSGLRAGGFDSDAAWMLTAFTKVSKTKSLWSEVFGVKGQTEKVSKLLATYGDRIAVFVDVAAETLQDENNTGSENHFIRLLKPVVWGPKVEFEVFSWGKNMKKAYKPENFEHMVYGYLVGAVDPSIDI